ncbi:MAG TPA: NADH:flavin oxidoreductase/NADH oxidase [Thermodesulfobacteriota bacterium]
MSRLFSPFRLRDIEFRHRVFVSPMCQYSSEDGMPTDWHLVHLGSRAVGGAALIMVEATAVSPEGRISPDDSGLWSDRHAEAFRRITTFLKAHGAVPGVQLAHAGRKASTDAPWRGGKPLAPSARGWQPVAPSAVPFGEGYPEPRELSRSDIDGVVAQFVDAARRALAAGFEVIELHMAHGYLLHSFLSPLANRRTDEYGGSLENRMRAPLAVAAAVRQAWPANRPLFVRISATDWVDGGFTLEEAVELSKRLAALGVDLIDCSSGGIVPWAKVPMAPGYQVPFAATIRREAKVPTAAVGLITAPEQAEQIVVTGQADAVFLGRELLRNPYWPLHASRALGAPLVYPPQYLRATPS